MYKKYSTKLRAVFESYAKQKIKREKKENKKKKEDSGDEDEGAARPTELDMGMPEWMKWCRDFKLITRR